MTADRVGSGSTNKEPATCGHPNHGNVDHDCKPFLPELGGLDFGAVNKEQAEPDSMWINAMSCIRPSDAFLADIGRDILAKLARAEGYPKEITMRFVAS